MRRQILFLILINILLSCSENPKQEKQLVQKDSLVSKKSDTTSHKEELVVNDSADILKTLVPFKYKDLYESYLDSSEKIEIPSFYGSWTISEIANAGGTVQKERTIRNQIGNKLFFSEEKFSFDFLHGKYEIANPESHIESFDIEDGPETKGTSYFFGYRPDRKKIYMLVIKEAGYFEIINYAEIAIYYDGRIYFLNKD